MDGIDVPVESFLIPCALSEFGYLLPLFLVSYSDQDRIPVQVIM